ncbi:cytoplasmic protein [Paenibacillus swuensis]|uniref:Cytoplasmic protein n=1 Tax=Paenibacillus swuensis TaxID=1178515 RepID=A0A172TL05_9BACL|nr:DUF4180 domain-containing protein [Paenibacillus swuensis]ANE47735.1 cytoplasmic protein [Paenibacillus swuensis]
MKISTVHNNGVNVAIVHSDEIIIYDVQSALDLMATVRYEVDSNHIIISKLLVSEEFFDLKTRMAGDILQKFINYQTKLAVIGDFTTYSSKSLRDFIYESNRGRDIFFLPDENQAIEKLSSV